MGTSMISFIAGSTVACDCPQSLEHLLLKCRSRIAARCGYDRSSQGVIRTSLRRAELRVDLMSYYTSHFSMHCSEHSQVQHQMARYHETPTRSAAKTGEFRQKYSLYQPVHGKWNRKPSVSKHGEKAQKERDALRASAESTSAPGKRRGTMRSKEHDEEEEEFRRAIEESKRANPGAEKGKRGGKRARDDSEE